MSFSPNNNDPVDAENRPLNEIVSTVPPIEPLTNTTTLHQRKRDKKNIKTPLSANTSKLYRSVSFLTRLMNQTAEQVNQTFSAADPEDSLYVDKKSKYAIAKVWINKFSKWTLVLLVLFLAYKLYYNVWDYQESWYRVDIAERNQAGKTKKEEWTPLSFDNWERVEATSWSLYYGAVPSCTPVDIPRGQKWLVLFENETFVRKVYLDDIYKFNKFFSTQCNLVFATPRMYTTQVVVGYQLPCICSVFYSENDHDFMINPRVTWKSEKLQQITYKSKVIHEERNVQTETIPLEITIEFWSSNEIGALLQNRTIKGIDVAKAIHCLKYMTKPQP